MRTVSKRELNQQTAAVLDRVTADEDTVVTERGKPRWRIAMLRDQETVLERLEREGRYTPPPAEPAPWPAQTGGPSYTADEVEALLGAMRGDH